MSTPERYSLLALKPDLIDELKRCGDYGEFLDWVDLWKEPSTVFSGSQRLVNWLKTADNVLSRVPKPGKSELVSTISGEAACLKNHFDVFPVELGDEGIDYEILEDEQITKEALDELFNKLTQTAKKVEGWIRGRNNIDSIKPELSNRVSCSVWVQEVLQIDPSPEETVAQGPTDDLYSKKWSVELTDTKDNFWQSVHALTDVPGESEDDKIRRYFQSTTQVIRDKWADLLEQGELMSDHRTESTKRSVEDKDDPASYNQASMTDMKIASLPKRRA